MNASEGLQTGLDSYIEQVRADWKNVGLAVAVVQGRDVVYARGCGVRQLGQTARIDPDTLFQVGSLTKAFAAAALGILVDEGRIRWDDLIIDHLPGFELQDSGLTRRVTIRDAVAHRSGVSQNRYPFLALMDSDEAVRHLRYITPEAAFRDSYVYSNLMYAVVGKITQAAAGMSWHDFIKRRLLQPLRMNRSGTSPYEFWDARHVTPTFFGSAPGGCPSLRDARDANIAMPHACDECGSIVAIPWQSYDNAAPAGSMVSSALDMANWMIMNLNEGCFEGRQLLRKETLHELHAPHNLRMVNQFPFERMRGSYAMGWGRAEYHGHSYLAHGGGIIGFPSYIALLPEQKMGVVVLSNSSQALHRAIVLWVFDRLLNVPSRDWSQAFLMQAQSMQREARKKQDELHRSRVPNAPPSLPLEQYVGAYETSVGRSGRVHVRVENGQLTLSFAGKGAFSAALEHWHHEVFRLRPSPGVDVALGPRFAEFTLDSAGNAASVTVFDATFRRLAVSDDPGEGP